MQSKNINLGANNIIADENVKGVIMNTIGQMLLMINMIEGMHKDVVAEKQRWNENINGVSHRTSMIQGAVEVLTKQRERTIMTERGAAKVGTCSRARRCPT